MPQLHNHSTRQESSQRANHNAKAVRPGSGWTCVGRPIACMDLPANDQSVLIVYYLQSGSHCHIHITAGSDLASGRPGAQGRRK